MHVKVVKAIKWSLSVVGIVVLLVIIHLFLLLNGVYLSIFGKSVVSNSLESFYNTSFVVYDSKKVDSTIIGVSHIDYYVYPEKNKDMKFKVAYSGGKELPASELSLYRLTKERDRFYKSLRNSCIDGECIEVSEFLEDAVPTVTEVSAGGIRVSRWDNVDNFSGLFELDVKFPEGFDKYVGFTELFSGLRSSRVEFDSNNFYINAYFGDEHYVLENFNTLPGLLANGLNASISSDVPLGYNVRVSLSTGDEYKGDIFLENIDSFVAESSN